MIIQRFLLWSFPRVLETPVEDVAATSTIRNAIPNVKTVTENVQSSPIVEGNEGLNLKQTIVCYREKRNNAHKKVYLSQNCRFVT